MRLALAKRSANTPLVRMMPVLLLVLSIFWLYPSCLHAQLPPLPDEEKPRVVVMTDIGGDPDDQQSIVRFLLYSCDFQVEGLCTGFGHGHYKQTRPDLLHQAVDAYGKVLSNLRKHRPDYPDYQYLKNLIKDGYNGDPHSVGPGMDSEASRWIMNVLLRENAKPVWFCIWGGPRELAQALWRMEKELPEEKFRQIRKKIRVHSIADQDRTAEWIKRRYPDIFWIYSNGLFRGIWKEGDQSLVSPQWAQEHVIQNHGPLGAIYPPKAAGKDGVKEGDTPSFFYVLPNGLSDPEHPEWGNWGGRFRRSGRGNEFVGTVDLRDGQPDMLYTIHRWRRAYQNAFQARMDWCVKPFEEANHEPVAVVQLDKTRKVLLLHVDPEQAVTLTAEGSSDPDGDKLSYKWWVYREAGTYWDAPPIAQDGATARLKVPRDAAGRTIHVILEVTDDGTPPLTSYRRVVLHVRGNPVPPPPDATLLDQQVKVIVPEPGKLPPGQWEFVRGININGQPVEIDGHKWEGEDAANYEARGKPLSNATVSLRPPTDKQREQMIRTFRFSRDATVVLRGLENGTYAVFLYVWEETSPTTFDIFVNDQLVIANFSSGSAGSWWRLGPWITQPVGGRISIRGVGGDANFCGIELWRKKSP